MSVDLDDPHFVLGVVGTGAMGQGIIQVALQGGLRAIAFDADADGLARARDSVFARLDRQVEKGRLEPEQVAAMKGNLSLANALSDLAPAGVVIEAVFEDLELKRRIFAELESVVAEDAILASNTSSLQVAAIAQACRVRTRVAGMHFFNPVPLMRLVEVVRGPQTGAQVVAALSALGERMGRTPVTVPDQPGFLVNLGGRAYTTEALRIQQERVATPAQVDAVMRDCWGYRMGPFELMDLTGMDVNFNVSMFVYEGYMDDARLRTTPHHRSLWQAGLYGRKTGAGHYRYDDQGRMIDPPSPDYASAARPAAKLILAEPHDALEAFCQDFDAEISDADDGESAILAAPLGEDASALAARLMLDHRRLVCVDLTGDLSRRVTLMTAPGAGPGHLDAVAALIVASGLGVTAIADSPGFIGQRMSALVANLGCDMAQMGLAEPEKIDLAMKLGLNYPRGPLELADFIGPRRLLRITHAIEAATGDDRYRPSLWLRRRAELGLSCLTVG